MAIKTIDINFNEKHAVVKWGVSLDDLESSNRGAQGGNPEVSDNTLVDIALFLDRLVEREYKDPSKKLLVVPTIKFYTTSQEKYSVTQANEKLKEFRKKKEKKMQQKRRNSRKFFLEDPDPDPHQVAAAAAVASAASASGGDG